MKNKIEEYLLHLETARRVTPTSLVNYRSTLNRFELFSKVLNEKAILSFCAQFADAATANSHLTRLRGLAKFHKVPTNRLVRAKEEVGEVEALTAAELLSLEEATNDSRVRATIVFLGETALRFAEYAAVTPRDFVKTADGVYLKVFGKGRKHRQVPVSARALQAWEGCARNPARREQDRIRLAMREAGKQADLAFDVHPHLLRASRISILINDGKSPVQVAAMVGHASLNTIMSNYYRPTTSALQTLVA